MSRMDLIMPPPDFGISDVGKVYPKQLPPTNLALLASIGRKIIPNENIKIIDGNIMPLGDIVKSIDADIVGIANWSISQKTSVELARIIKKKNPNTKVIFGGPNASHLAEKILLNQSSVDIVIRGDGELALWGILSGDKLTDIPNLAFRQDDKVVLNQIKRVDINNNPFFDFDNLVGGYDSQRVPVPISGIRGCIKAMKGESCSYCSIFEKNIRLISSEKIWRQVGHLKKLYGVEYFFETGDDFFVGKYPETLLKERPKNLESTRWRIYTYPSHLSEKNIVLLKKLGITTLFVGIETITPQALKISGRDIYGIDHIKKIAEIVRKYKLRAIFSFIFGLPGESQETTKDNINFIRYLAEFGPDVFEAISISSAIPVVGSRLFQLAIKNEDICRDYIEKTGQDINKTDIFDYQVLTRLFLNRITKIPYDWLTSQIAGINDIVKESGIITSNFVGTMK